VTRHIALLRGVNLGRNRRLLMADLRGVVERLGYDDIRTHLQSGNIVLTCAKKPGTVKRELEGAIADELGLETEVFMRTRDELADVVARDPLGKVADDPARYRVSFLSAKPDAAVVRELAKADVAPEQFVVHGREAYAWLPAEVQRSKVAILLSERKLGVTSTVRNWNTVTKLLALADE
jgi:uncharacterized protein (DUF1697 family)